MEYCPAFQDPPEPCPLQPDECAERHVHHDRAEDENPAPPSLLEVAEDAHSLLVRLLELVEPLAQRQAVVGIACRFTVTDNLRAALAAERERAAAVEELMDKAEELSRLLHAFDLRASASDLRNAGARLRALGVGR